ncbi:glucose dehydrogenase [acceptor] [Elysia marginata]|uniref:Glucose dehydrogenase [acceptor] n=1 Tax=Elysia marginata TaxID=1093978 RepID=A0AAV4IQL4_9GAST|nr:glucose dehydrogenase [acceptor] [Elysia marginata]
MVAAVAVAVAIAVAAVAIIPVVADLPVGENLQDHLFYEFSIGVNQTVSATEAVQESLWTRMQLNLFGSGP